MPASDLVIKGAREHNLRSVDLVLPRNQLICLTGVSGSGKSSLAFDTLYAEGQRRYVESLSSFARQFLGQLPKPDVDYISGLSPSISIAQKSAGNNPRSTVGTITEIYDYLRVLFARVGQGYCPKCQEPVTAQSREQILAQILEYPKGTRFTVLAPVISRQKGEYRDLFADFLKQGFSRARVNGQVYSLNDVPSLDRRMRHDIDVVVDRLEIKNQLRPRLAEAVDLALKMGAGTLVIAAEIPLDVPTPGSATARRKKKSTKDILSTRDEVFSVHYACQHCQVSFGAPTPQLFSFNSPQGMCQECDGLGQLYSFDADLLVPDPELSFKQGCFELLGKWKKMGRWRRHIYQGVADTMERARGWDPGYLLETAWQDMEDKARAIWLWGTGDTHITFTWRSGSSPMKYGGEFQGLVPDLMSRYRSSKSRPQRRQLERYMRTITCPECEGQRLVRQARSVTITTAAPSFAENPRRSLPDLCHLSVREAVVFFEQLVLSETAAKIAEEAVREIRGRLQFLINVGLDYLTLDRTAPTLSGGESQRIRLAAQLGSGLVGVLYILDEPSIGLHARDNERLLETLQRLRDQGNTVLVVEHDEETMRAADHLVDFGPGPGVRGGDVVAAGSLQDVMDAKESVTGQYLCGVREITVPTVRRPRGEHWLTIRDASQNNLKHQDVAIPLGTFTCVTGVSGSGKSSLVNDILVEALRRDLNQGIGDPGTHGAMEGLDQLDKMIAIDQSPIGRTPRSNPATYIKVFDDIRHLFAQLPESKRRGFGPGRFSFNVDQGRCEACNGNGTNRLEMDFLADVWVTCPICQGRRFNRETLQVKFKDHTISDVLEMDIQQALALFENVPKVCQKLQTLRDVGLDYIKLGQPSPTLSGGEAQRIKLARELTKKSTGQTIYVLDEPTTGLHFADIQLLLKVLHGFVEAGNTVLVVEHNIDVIKTADWIIDLGPEGGEQGGTVVAVGTPEEVAEHEASHTGRSLRPALGLPARKQRVAGPKRTRKTAARQAASPDSRLLRVRGAQQHNLKMVDAEIRREAMTVFCGPSGSGKSSLAMDTIYAEGQRRYVESLSSYARQFINQMQKPRLEHIEGLSPAIAIEQKNLGNTPRSTVGTVTEIYDYLRILMARLGVPHCPDCNIAVGRQTVDEIVDKVLAEPAGSRLYLMAPLDLSQVSEVESLWEEMRAAGYVRVRVDGQTHSLDDPPEVDRRSRHRVEVIVDRVKISSRSRSRIADSIENALELGNGLLYVAYVDEDLRESRWQVKVHSQFLACDACGRSLEQLTPHNFSFNSYLGWCSSCEGLGTQTGANPAALIRDPKATLAEGALDLWPNLQHPVAERMLQALASELGLPLDVPLDQIDARQRRFLMHGTGDQWFTVYQDSEGNKRARSKPMFRFQFKGLYPALEEASRLSPALRAKLEHLVDEVECSSCGGSRLREDAASVRFVGRSMDELCRQPLGTLLETVEGWKLPARDQKIAGELVREIRDRLQFLNDIGLHYLSLSRPAASLSNGEAQRIRLASQLGSGLCGVLYVLDEPTIGLHPRDSQRLIQALQRLRDLGNTLLVVEHDRELIAASDRLCDFGPAAGRHGGEIVARGTPAEVSRRRKSVTGPYLSGKKSIPIPTNRRMTENGEPLGGQWLEVVGARHHNLRDINVRIPLSTLTAITGPSGSGKSSLVDEVLYVALARRLHRAKAIPGLHDQITGLEFINKVIRVDQNPLGNSPTSNPATYTGMFELIRSLFAQLPEAKLRGFTPRRFSFNVAGGRCDACDGNGQKCVEMHFLPDVWIRCDVCQGKRYNPETLAVKYRGHSISDILDLTCQDAVRLFENIPKIRRIVQTLCDVGLDYLTLGQAAPTLSGGEAQRVKLAAELARPDTGQTLYLLDEPTTGLHFDDLAKLLDVIHRLVDLGNTVVVIEHNLDIIKSADWLIDLGPEAGADGGQVVVTGTPEQVVSGLPAGNGSSRKKKRKEMTSHTAIALAPVLEQGPHVERTPYDPGTLEEVRDGDLEIQDVGKEASMPWETDGPAWHTQGRVDRKGQACRWDGKVLDQVVKRIQQLGSFSETDWSTRTVVEIAASKKSTGWFFHAITGETWLLKMKFRVARGTFQRKELMEQLPLKTLNQMEELPVYGNNPRIKVKTLRGPWQEVQVHAYSWEEIDTPAFWDFLEQAVAGFGKITERAKEDPQQWMPWKKMGQKWHFLRKGFPVGKSVAWKVEVLEELFEILVDILPEGHFLWNNQNRVHLYDRNGRDPWATVLTKRAEDVTLMLRGPTGKVALGRLSGLGRDRSLDQAASGHDVVKLAFRIQDDLHRGDLVRFLQDHLAMVQEATST